jgi:hypothetical protein
MKHEEVGREISEPSAEQRGPFLEYRPAEEMRSRSRALATRVFAAGFSVFFAAWVVVVWRANTRGEYSLGYLGLAQVFLSAVASAFGLFIAVFGDFTNRRGS